MVRKVPEKNELSKVKEQVSKLKSKCRKLQKENRALQKQLQIFEMVYDSQDMTEARRVTIKERRLPKCDHCGSTEMHITEVGIWTLETCMNCGYRGRSQNEGV